MKKWKREIWTNDVNTKEDSYCRNDDEKSCCYCREEFSEKRVAKKCCKEGCEVLFCLECDKKNSTCPECTKSYCDNCEFLAFEVGKDCCFDCVTKEIRKAKNVE